MSALGRAARGVDRLNEAVGRAVSWLALALVLVQFTVVVLRYVFGLGFVMLQDTIVYLFAIMFLAASGYALLHDAHVRIDIFYREAPARRKAAVNLAGAVLLLIPAMVAVFWTALPYVVASWLTLEGSGNVGGLPTLFLLKSFILVFAVLTALQGLALALRGASIIAGRGTE